MRSDSAPLSIYCSSAAAKVSPILRLHGHEKSHADGWVRVVVLHTEHVIQEQATTRHESTASQRIKAQTGLLLEAVLKTMMASLVDGRGERAELCQPRFRRGAGQAA